MGLTSQFSPILQNLCDFLRVHLAWLISQINRPSSQLAGTFNPREGQTQCAPRDQLETHWRPAPWAPQSLRGQDPQPVRAGICSWVHRKADMSQSTPQLHTPDLPDDGVFAAGLFWFLGRDLLSSENRVIANEKTGTDVFWCYRWYYIYIWNIVLTCYFHYFIYGTELPPIWALLKCCLIF